MSEAEPAIPITPDMLLSRRIDFERRMRRAPPVTLAIIAALAGVFAHEQATGALASRTAIERAGALVRSGVLAGEYWRLLSATVLHGSLGHLVGNAIALFILGMVCEHAFGRRRFLVLYVVSGLCGSLLSVAWHPGPAVGASGAIFGLQGAAIVLFGRHRDRLLVRDRRIGVVLLVWAVYSVASGFVTPYVDNGAHLGGGAGGALLATRLRPVVLDGPGSCGSDGAIAIAFWLALTAVTYAMIGWLLR